MPRGSILSFLLAFVVATGSACAGSDLQNELQASPEAETQENASATVGEAARSADAFVNSIGVNVHLSYLDRVYGSGFNTIIKPKLAKLGVRHLRDGGQVNGNDDWMRTIYGRMQEIAQIGPKFTLIVSPQGTDYSKAGHVVRLMQFAAPAVEALEGPNEFDMRGMASWATKVRTFQRALYTRVKNDPALRAYPVLGPSLGRAGRASEVGDLRASMDAASVHLYPGGGIPTTSMSYTLTQTVSMNGPRPVWITETGYHNATAGTDPHAAVSERVAGRYITRLFLDYFNAGIDRSYAYELIDLGADRKKREFNFGLLRVDGSEKPAYRALSNLIALVGDSGPTSAPGRLDFVLKGDMKDVRRTLLQKRDGTFYLMLWIDAVSYDITRRVDVTVPVRNLTVELRTSTRRARVFDPFTSRTAFSVVESPRELTIKVSDTPVVVELTR